MARLPRLMFVGRNHAETVSSESMAHFFPNCDQSPALITHAAEISSTFDRLEATGRLPDIIVIDVDRFFPFDGLDLLRDAQRDPALNAFAEKRAKLVGLWLARFFQKRFQSGPPIDYSPILVLCWAGREAFVPVVKMVLERTLPPPIVDEWAEFARSVAIVETDHMLNVGQLREIVASCKMS